MKESERVVLKALVPAEGLETGDVGTVVHVYGDGKAYEVEFLTLDGRTAAGVALEAMQVRPVGQREITTPGNWPPPNTPGDSIPGTALADRKPIPRWPPPPLGSVPLVSPLERTNGSA